MRIPDAVWSNALTFHCPICNESGQVSHTSKSSTAPVYYTAPEGHRDLGGGDFECRALLNEVRRWKVSRFAGRPGGATPRALDHVEPANWLDYHDRLVEEWVDGERKLIDDLYPASEKTESPTRSRSWVPKNKTACLYLGLASVNLVCVVLNLAADNALLTMLWFMVMFLNLLTAWTYARN